MPDIIQDLNVPVTTGQWLTSGYSLVMAIVMPLSAFLITRFPTKRLYATAAMHGVNMAFLGMLLSDLVLLFLALWGTRKKRGA